VALDVQSDMTSEVHHLCLPAHCRVHHSHLRKGQQLPLSWLSLRTSVPPRSAIDTGVSFQLAGTCMEQLKLHIQSLAQKYRFIDQNCTKFREVR